MTKKEIHALINLLDDPNEDVYEPVMKNLISKGTGIIPELEKAWENTDDQFHQDRLEQTIQKIQYNHSISTFRLWIQSGYTDLLEGIYLLTRFQYPDLQFSEIIRQIEKIQKDVWIELNNNLTALEKIRILNHIMFDVHKFSRNTGDFYNPANSYINKVLDMKQGNPISLAIVYSVIAQRLGMPVYGVNLPRNFILAYRDDSGPDSVYDDQSEDILFYINPYNKGAVHSKKEIDYFLREQKIAVRKSYFIPCSNLDIIERVINNLINSYERLNNKEKVKMYKAIRKELGKEKQG